MPKRIRKRRKRTMLPWLVWGGAGVVVVAAVLLAILPMRATRPAPQATADRGREVVITMGGFEPNYIVEAAGKPITLTLVNPDSSFHTDGGGWHQFGSDSLKLDVRIPPHSRKTITLGPLKAGKYDFYCDICCGGKTSPSMQGTLEITG